MTTFWIELLIRFTVCSFCILTYCTVILVISHIGFEGGTLFLIASVPGHCLSFTFQNVILKTLKLNGRKLIAKKSLKNLDLDDMWKSFKDQFVETVKSLFPYQFLNLDVHKNQLK